MIQEEIARLTGTLKFNVDSRPLISFEKKLAGVASQLQKFGQVANKKFAVKVSLDSKLLREQLERASSSKVTFKNFSVSQEALTAAAKRISTRLNATPIKLTHVKVDIAALVAQKSLVRTLLGQMSIQLPITLKMQQAEAQLRAWKNNTEAKFTLRLNADISQARFIANVRKSLRAAQAKIGIFTVRVHDPKLRLSVDQANLRAQIRAAISAAEFDVRVRVRRGAGGGGNGGPSPRADRISGAAAGGIAGAGMGFLRGAIPGFGAAFAFAQLNKINQQMQAQALAMTAVMGSQEAGNQQSQWVKNLANNVGMDYRQVAPSYNKMLASGQTSGMSTKSVQNIFQGVSEYGRVMGLDSDTMKGSMRAIEQMMNKGQVMSEELKGQLAERMPGAISAMAEAAGFGADKESVGKLFDAMQKGTVKSADVLEKFGNILAVRARSGGALDKAKTSTAAEQARMNNSFTDAVVKFAEGGFDKGMANFFRAMAQGMEKALPGVENLGNAFEGLIEPVNAMINVGGTVLKMLPEIGKTLGLTGGQLAALGVTAGLVMLPFGGVAAAIAAIALALDDLIVYSEGGDSMFGRWLESSPEAETAFKALAAEASTFGENLKMAFEQATELGGALDGLSFPDMIVATMKELTALMSLFNKSIDRFVAAGQYAQQTNTTGTTVEANARNMLGTIMGPDWVNAQLWSKYSAENLASVPQSSGESLTAQSQLAMLVEIRDKLATTEAMRLPDITVNMPVNIDGVPSTAPDSMALMPGMVMDAFKDILSNAMVGLKETK